VGPDGSFVPGQVLLCSSGWEIGAFDPTGGNDTPGAENDCVQFIAIDLEIWEIQGSGDSSSYVGQYARTTGIVVADFQADDQLDGFFLQTADAFGDADPLTSDGIFVYCGGCSTDVAVGDAVEVTGQVGEYFGMSQIDVTGGIVNFLSSGNSLPTPATIDLPASGSTMAEATFENVEGMLVTFPDTLYVSEYYELARYDQLVLTADARPPQFTDANEPSVAGYSAFLDDLNSKRIILDDDNNTQNNAISGVLDKPYFWPRPGLSNSNYIRGGDSITNLTGVLHWSYAGQTGTDAWRVRPVEPAFSYNFTSNNERTADPEDVGGSLKVASFNVLNYFTTIDSRGADSTAELDRQRAKTAAAICAIDADVYGLIEIENNGAVAINDLLEGTNGINANCGPYAFIDTGVIGTDEITVAFIYKTATAASVGNFEILDSSVDSRFIDTKNRPALAQTFVDTSTGGVFTVVVNHLKSKGSDCDELGDPDALDGQGNCNLTRTAAAAAMVDWLASDPTGSGDPDFLIIGDLNSYRNEDPIDTLEAGADDAAGNSDDYTDLLDTLIGSSAYSYLFDGQLGYLDHALAGSHLVGEVSDVTVWHINADEIPVFDYNDEIQDGSNEQSYERESSALPIYAPDAYRSSDHDPVIIGLELTTQAEIYELIDDVQMLVDDGVLNDGQGNALTSKLENVLEKLAKGHTNAAANQLGAFINQVEDFVDDGILTVEQGDQLISAATLLVEALSN
jgi:predicted extracellular nuclease